MHEAVIQSVQCTFLTYDEDGFGLSVSNNPATIDDHLDMDKPVNITLNSTLLQNDESHTQLAMWGFWVKFVLTPVIVFIGIVGNMLSVIVMKTKTLRKKTYSHYICALSTFDTLTLVIRQVRISDEFYFDVLNRRGLFQQFDDSSCKVFNFIEHVSYLMSSWLVVSMAFERFVAVCFPFRNSLIRKQMCAGVSICSLLAVMSLSQSFRLVMVEHIVLDPRQDTRVCGAADTYLHIYSNLTIYFYSMTLTFVLPVCTVLVCNSLVLIQMYRVRRAALTDKASRYNTAVNRKYRTTCMLLTVSFTYIVTLLPLLALTIIVDVLIKHGSKSSQAIVANMWPVVEVAETISLMNYACNFFIYVLSGKKFRYELRQLFTARKTPKRMTFRARSTRETFSRL